MKSFKQMRLDGELKRADGEQIEYCNIHVEPGFNPPGRTEEDDQDDEELYQLIVSGNRLPAMDVRPRPDGGVWIVDGHRRHKQIGRAIAAGKFLPSPKDGKIWIRIQQFTGNDIKRVAHIAVSNKKKALPALQLADVYGRLAGFGLTADEIAKEVHCSRSHVDSIMILAGANHDVQKMVKDGSVSATLAIDTTRKHQDAAGPVLAAALTKAKASGKKRVTATGMMPKTGSMDALDAERYRKILELDGFKCWIAEQLNRNDLELDSDISAAIDALRKK